jgi:peptide/nickel transport system permease protein
MLSFLARRAVAALVLAFAVASGGLLLARLGTSDFAEITVGFGPESQKQRLREQHGLNRPVLEHYVDWLTDVARLDFGTSMQYSRPVAPLVAERAVNSAILAGAALLVACGLGIPIGILSGSRQGLIPHAVRAVSVTCLSVPPLIGSLLLVWMAALTGLFPVGGMITSEAESAHGLVWLRDLVWHLPVPVLALALPMAAMLERVQAQSMASALEEPCIAAALARGASRARVVWVHALRLSAGTPIAIGGVLAGVLLSGSLAVELVTAWPGLGLLTFEALKARDVPLVAGCATAAAMLVSIGLVASDVLLVMNDRRVLDERVSAVSRPVRAGGAL